MESVHDYSDDHLAAIRLSLIEWYEEHARPYPWRQTTDPYAILVCEVMSQQTQLERIVSPWRAFLDRWSTVEALAEAERSSVVSFWTAERLGYNRRAVYLHNAAKHIVEDYDGSFPSTVDELLTLPGVGPYTANAVASFAFNQGGAVVDTNVKRVLHRAFAVPDDDDAFDEAADRLLPADRSKVWNNAIMELGGTLCSKRPRCDDGPCPWRDTCHAYHTVDFTAPDVPTQPQFAGSRRQFRGRIVRTLHSVDEIDIEKLGHHIRVDFDPSDERGRSWIQSIVDDLVNDGLVEYTNDDRTVVRLQH